MDPESVEFEKKYKSELEILRDYHPVHDDIYKVSELKLLHAYILETFREKIDKFNERKYFCNIVDSITGKKMRLYSNYSLTKEIDKFRKLRQKDKKIYFWVTRKRVGQNGYLVGDVNVSYHDRNERREFRYECDYSDFCRCKECASHPNVLSIDGYRVEITSRSVETPPISPRKYFVSNCDYTDRGFNGCCSTCRDGGSCGGKWVLSP